MQKISKNRNLLIIIFVCGLAAERFSPYFTHNVNIIRIVFGFEREERRLLTSQNCTTGDITTDNLIKKFIFTLLRWSRKIICVFKN